MRIAYIFNHKSFFGSHYLPIANEVKKKNEIKLFCGKDASKTMEKYYRNKIRNSKINISEFNIHPTKLSFFSDICNFYYFLLEVKKFKPDTIHCATPKGILIGGLISFFLKIKSLVIFNTGMGFLFSNKLDFLDEVAKFFYIFFLKNIILKHKNKAVIVENINDKKFFNKNMSVKKNNIYLINGSGVDLNKFKNKYSINRKLVILPSRVIKEKGVIEFCEAAKLLKKDFCDWNYMVVGALDYSKKSKINNDQLKYFSKDLGINFLGFKKNILKYLKMAGIICLPSYREGLSKVLLEASALGIPIVTSNVTGCRDAIIPGKTGLLCKVKNYKSLYFKLKRLMIDAELRKTFSKNGIALAKEKYDINNVIKSNIFIYNKLNKQK